MSDNTKANEENPAQTTAAVFPELPSPDTPSGDKTVTWSEYTKMKAWFDKQIEEMGTNYSDICEQINDFKGRVGRNEALTQRVERLATLMTQHMSYFGQLVELVDSYGDRIVANEKIIHSMDLKFDTLVNKQQQFSTVAAEMRKNTKMIISEIEKLNTKVDENDKFKYKLTAACAIGGSILVWLIAGDNASKVVTLIQNLFGAK